MVYKNAPTRLRVGAVKFMKKITEFPEQARRDHQ